MSMTDIQVIEQQGVSAYDIGQLLGRSLEGVEGRLHRLRKAGKI